MARARIVLLLLAVAGAGLACGRRVVGRLDASGDASVVPDLPQVCTSEGWCWTHPLPTSDRFVAAYAVGVDDLWLIGASGTIVRYAGGRWSTVPSPTSALSAIWASAANDVLVGGPAGPYRWNGAAWTMIPTPASPGGRPVYSIWGCSPSDVWIVGALALHWDGNELTYPRQPILPGYLRAVWGSACRDVWAGALIDGSGAGRMMRWDGGGWLDIASQPAERIAGTGPDESGRSRRGSCFTGPGPGRDSP